MKRLFLICAITFAALQTVFAQSPLNFLNTERLNPLDSAERDRWRTDHGEWKFDTVSITGSGDSKIVYNRIFQPPFRLSFEIEVIDGIRPRIFIGRYKLANEDQGRTLAFYPTQAKSKKFSYTTGRKYPVQIDITKDRMDVRVGGQLIDSRTVGMETIPPIAFHGGDGFSKGTTRFSNILIQAKFDDSPAKSQ